MAGDSARRRRSGFFISTVLFYWDVWTRTRDLSGSDRMRALSTFIGSTVDRFFVEVLVLTVDQIKKFNNLYNIVPYRVALWLHFFFPVVGPNGFGPFELHPKVLCHIAGKFDHDYRFAEFGMIGLAIYARRRAIGGTRMPSGRARDKRFTFTSVCWAFLPNHESVDVSFVATIQAARGVLV